MFRPLFSQLSQASGPDKGNLPQFDILPIQKIPRCVPPNGQIGCVTIVYSPDNSTFVTEVMNAVAANNGIPNDEVLTFRTQDSVDDYIWDHPGAVYSAVEFSVDKSQISYTLQVALAVLAVFFHYSL